MDDRQLDHLLAQRREAPLPALAPTFQQGVWREIRRRKADEPVTWFGWLLEPLCRPAMAYAGLALALALGVVLGPVSVDSRNMQTRRALDLQVFGSSSPSLPATLMDYTR
jgi:hypothetical protein